MDIAIIGLAQCGKTTVFNALTRGIAETSGASDMHIGVVKVPDPRLGVLAGMYSPRKVISAEIKYWDVPGADHDGKSQGLTGRHRNVLQSADAFLLVVPSEYEAIPMWSLVVTTASSRSKRARVFQTPK